MQLVLRTLLLISIAIVASSCSQKGDLEKHLRHGDQALARHDLETAKKAFLRANELDYERPEPLLGLTQVYLQRGRLKHAYQAVTRVLKLDPDNAKAKQLLANTYLRAKRFDDAIDTALEAFYAKPTQTQSLIVFAKAHRNGIPAYKGLQRLDETIDGDPDLHDLHLARGILLAKAGKESEARERLNQALALVPDSTEALLQLADLNWRFNDLSAAEAFFTRANASASPYSSAALDFAKFCSLIGNKEKAISILEANTEAFPDLFPSQLELAELYYDEERYLDGIQHTATLLELSPTDPKTLLLDGKLKLSAGDQLGAISSLELLVKHYPNSSSAQLQLGTAYLANEQPEKALSHLQMANRISPDSSEAAILLAGLDVRKADFLGAIIKLREFSDRNSSNLEVRRFLADTLFAKGDTKDALELYLSLAQLQTDDPEIPHAIALCLLHLRQVAEARATFRRCLDIDSSYFPAVEQLAIIDATRGKHDLAHQHLESYATENGKTHRYHHVKGVLFFDQLELQNAEAELREAINIAPDKSQSYFLLSQVLIAADRIDEAIASLQSAEASSELSIDNLMLLGSLLEGKGRILEATEVYQHVIELDSQFAPALNNLAYLYSVHLDDLSKAYELAERARRADPNNPEIADTLGWILYKQENYAWAMSVLTESASKLPSNSEILYHLGMTHYMLGNADASREYLQRAVNSDTTFSGKSNCQLRIDILDTNPHSITKTERETLNDQLAADPQDTICLLILAKEKIRNGSYLDATNLLQCILNYTPENGHALHQLAIIKSELNQPEQAFELAKKAYSILPDNAEVKATLGTLAYSSRRFQWAATLLSGIPNDKVKITLAKSQFAIGENAGALASIATAAEPNDPDYAKQLHALFSSYQSDTSTDGVSLPINDPDPLIRLSSQALKAESDGHIEEAINLYKQCLAHAPTFKTAKKSLASLYFENALFSETALNITREASLEYAADIALKTALAVQYFHLGYNDKAQKILNTLPETNIAILYTSLINLTESDSDSAREMLSEIDPATLPEHQKTLHQEALASLESESFSKID